jgi:signal transduction histidine kinase
MIPPLHRPVRRSLQWKVVLTMVGVGMLPMIAALLWAGLYGRSALINASGEKFTELARLVSSQIDFIIDREINEARSLILSEELQDAVAAANHSDSTGATDGNGADPTLLTSPASRYLQAYHTLKQDEYDEILATDRRGQIIAATRTPRQRLVAEEPWWRAAYHDGTGAVFLSDFYQMPGEPLPWLDVALPITDSRDQTVIGVLKFVIKDLDLTAILKQVTLGETGHAMLVRGNGQVLLCPTLPAAEHPPIPEMGQHGTNAGWAMQTNGHSGGPTVVAHAPITFASRFSTDTARTIAVVVTQKRSELFDPIHHVLWVTSGLGLLLFAALWLLGMVAGRRLVRPILTIQQGAQELGRGNLGHRLQISTGDELETLSHTINQMAEDLQESAESRLQAERLTALHRLSTVLTHDLRSPMVGILKAMALLQQTYGRMPVDRARQLLSDLIRGGELLLGTLNDLLDVYRHSLSALPLRCTEVRLSEAIDEVIRLLHVDAEVRGIRIRTDIADPSLTLLADRRRLQRVIVNLMDNAIKHSPFGGQIILTVGPLADGQIMLSVEDEGAGVSEHDHAHIFEFLSSATNVQMDRAECSGIGVGLYFCRMTVEAHDGEIHVETRPNGGARFVVTLPVRQTHDPHEQEPALPLGRSENE